MSIVEHPPARVAGIRVDDEAPPFDAMKRAGLIGVELLLPSNDDSGFDSVRHLVTDACTRFSAAGWRTTSLSVSANAISNIGSPDPKQRDAAARQLIATMDLASVLGARVITITAAIVCSEGGAPLQRYEDAYHYSLKSMMDLRFEAAARCIRIACRIGHAGFLLSPLDSRLWLDQINSPWVGGRIDPSAIARHGSPADWIRTLGHRLFATDVSDSATPGDSSLRYRFDWGELYPMLHEIGSDTVICVDPTTSVLDSLTAFDRNAPRKA